MIEIVNNIIEEIGALMSRRNFRKMSSACVERRILNVNENDCEERKLQR